MVKHPTVKDNAKYTRGVRSASAASKPAQTFEPAATSAPLQILRVLLFAGGLTSVVACFVVLALMIINDMAFGGLIKTWHLLIWSAVVVNSGFYAWVVARNWQASSLLMGGVLVHLHLLFWVSQMSEDKGSAFVAAILLFGLLIYATYTRIVWRQEKISL